MFSRISECQGLFFAVDLLFSVASHGFVRVWGRVSFVFCNAAIASCIT